jgi:hypothetical protein
MAELSEDDVVAILGPRVSDAGGGNHRHRGHQRVQAAFDRVVKDRKPTIGPPLEPGRFTRVVIFFELASAACSGKRARQDANGRASQIDQADSPSRSRGCPAPSRVHCGNNRCASTSFLPAAQLSHMAARVRCRLDLRAGADCRDQNQCTDRQRPPDVVLLPCSSTHLAFRVPGSCYASLLCRERSAPTLDMAKLLVPSSLSGHVTALTSCPPVPFAQRDPW